MAAQVVLASFQLSSSSESKMSQKAANAYWLQSVQQWYPQLHTRTHFLPPLHFNRDPRYIETVAGQPVMAPRKAEGKEEQPLSSVKSSAPKSQSILERFNQSLTAKLPSLNSSYTLRHSQLGKPCSPESSPENGVSDNSALQRVLHSLRAMADHSQPKEVMMVLSQLQFGKFLGKPSYAAANAFHPQPMALSSEYQQDDCDVLIMHNKRGLFTVEVNCVGTNFGQLTTTQKKHALITKELKNAVSQLNKAEVVLRYLVSDLDDVSVCKIVALPNVRRKRLLKALTSDLQTAQELCQCLGTKDLTLAADLCLCKDLLPHEAMPWDVPVQVKDELIKWWRRCTSAMAAHKEITPSTYGQLVARFCGSATTVEIPCFTQPHLEIRAVDDRTTLSGERIARFALFPDQLDLLHTSLPRMFLSGPPGTGKSVVLLMQALSWLQRGHDVSILSSWNKSRAAAILIEYQLLKAHNSSCSGKSLCTHQVLRHQFDFKKGEDLHEAVDVLKSTVSAGRQLCVIADEAGPNDSDNSKRFTQFCELLIQTVPTAWIWAAAMERYLRPPSLPEISMTTPLRSPAPLVKEVEKAVQIQNLGHVQPYTPTPPQTGCPTDSASLSDYPAITRVRHRDGHLEHRGSRPDHCEQCGREIAGILSELNIGAIRIDDSSHQPPLKYRDVLVLCDCPADDRLGDSGQLTSSAIGLVKGLRAGLMPVSVIGRDANEADVRSLALGLADTVTVTHRDNVRGLERKVVALTDVDVCDLESRLHGISRSSAYVVWIDWLEDDENNN